ncbi:XF1762 family protein [Streptomyces sp. NPDC004539]|uniref:XF1762 family protein n=1 Tax=Streptomyces sp. NPDC004539 TaxID=3154280 RepID=UPI0033A74576
MTDQQERLTIVPLTFREACDIVDLLHRHHRRPQGHRFSIGVLRPDGALCGVAIVGHPISRILDDRLTIEVTRVATDGTPNACSASWGAASRMGFRRAITYTQDCESGASLRAVGWKPVAVRRPRAGWDTPSRRREDQGTESVGRILWEQRRGGALELPPSSEGFRRPASTGEDMCRGVRITRPRSALGADAGPGSGRKAGSGP